MINETDLPGAASNHVSAPSKPIEAASISNPNKGSICGQITAENAPYHAGLWIRNNAQPWEYLKSKAQHETSHERQFSMRWLVDELRRVDLVDNNGEPCRVSNTLIPSLARYLVQEMPSAKEFIVLKRSKANSYFEAEEKQVDNG